MKRCLDIFFRLFIAAFIYPSYIYAQSSLSRWTHAPQPGDTLKQSKCELQFRDISTGDNVVWDFSSCKILNAKRYTVFKNSHDNVGGIFASGAKSNHLYALNEDILNILMSENNLQKVSYRMPEQVVDFSLKLGDRRTSVFDGCYNYCDIRFCHIFGQKELSVIGRGTFIMPSGVCLKNVVLLHDVKKTLLDNISVQDDSMSYAYVNALSFTSDSIESRIRKGQSGSQTERYCWYSPYIRYPLLELKMSDDASNNLYECYMLDDSVVISDNSVPMKKKAAYKNARNYNEAKIGGLSYCAISLEGLSCDVVGNNASALSVVFKAEDAIYCEYGIYTLDGKSIIEKSEQIPRGVSNKTLYLPYIPQEALLFRLSVNGKKASIKITNIH